MRPAHGSSNLPSPVPQSIAVDCGIVHLRSPTDDWNVPPRYQHDRATRHLFAPRNSMLDGEAPMHVTSGALLDRWTALTDEDVVVRVVDGQTALFELLMRRHNERVYRVARAILRDDAEAEDVMQQAYVNAYTHLRQFDRRASFATWLTRIAVHEALARARRRGRYVSMEPEDDRPFDALTPVDT